MVGRKDTEEIVPRTEAVRPYSLATEFDRMFEDLDSWFWGPSLSLTPRMAADGPRVPRVNVKEEADRYVVTAEMPGVRREDLELSIRENMLEICSKESEEAKDEDSGYIYREVRRSSFHRRIGFGQDIVPEQSGAELKDGMLTVSLKKAEAEEPKRHSIAVR